MTTNEVFEYAVEIMGGEGLTPDGKVGLTLLGTQGITAALRLFDQVAAAGRSGESPADWVNLVAYMGSRGDAVILKQHSWEE